MEAGASKYNIAWFKLAEFIARKEKERALGMFKLLSHSLDDKGLVCQLEGDIFLSFGEHEQAVKSYLQAADLYEKSIKYVPAIAIYEHLVSLKPDFAEYAFKMFNLAVKTKRTYKIQRALRQLVQNLQTEKAINELDVLISDSDLNLENCMLIYEQIVLHQSKIKKISESHFYKYIERIIDGLSQTNSKKLDDFLNKLENLNDNLYNYSVSYLLKKNNT